MDSSGAAAKKGRGVDCAHDGCEAGTSSKKARVEGSTEAVVNPAVLASRAALRQQYDSSQPYTHCVMHDIFDPSLLAEVRDEIVNNIEATYKETDLFKLFQTGGWQHLIHHHNEFTPQKESVSV